VFEGLRDRASALGDPKVHLRTLGTRRDYGARETFVSNLLAAGGVGTSEDASRVAVLASSPSGYAGHAAAAVRDLRSAAERVLVAGRASELGDQADLVDGEVHDGMDVAAFLSELLDHLGAPPEAAGPTDDPDATAPKEGRR
jgi:methylmalonyl-CoA mutase